MRLADPKPHCSNEIAGTMTKILDQTQIETALASLSEWKLERGELVRILAFKDFQQAMKFVNQVAALADKAGHHPDIDIRYNKVRLALVTHDAGGITQSDISLAQDIDKKSLEKLQKV
jgi:4a-hydroxytetrahydrobiopterin dehydratase